ncbi:MAG: Holliday junction resolvase RuvX [Rhodanobacter sp.]
MSCILGFDVGSRLTGVAVGNMLTVSARPLGTVAMREGNPDWRQLDAMRDAWLPDMLVVGLPLQLDGSEQASSRAARSFASELHSRYALPVAFVDERDSSREAAQRFARARASGSRRRSDRAGIDADAAAIILERWLLQSASGTSKITPG